MSDVNWWLVALAFVLGLVLTGAFVVRRVPREVPVAAGFVTALPKVQASPKVSAPTVSAPTDSAPTDAAWSEAAATEAVVDPPAGPHGPGSARPGAGGGGPEGWTVKGNEESKLYHSAESPSYGITRAEVWFRDVETAEAAGFNRWDSGKSQRGKR